MYVEGERKRRERRREGEGSEKIGKNSGQERLGGFLPSSMHFFKLDCLQDTVFRVLK